MMPLWTTATLSVACGWALFSVGLPWVAQRVWPMPVWPASGGAQPRFQVLAACLRRGGARGGRFQRRDAGGIVAAIFEPLQRIDQLLRDRIAPENADNATHADPYLHRSSPWRCRS